MDTLMEILIKINIGLILLAIAVGIIGFTAGIIAGIIEDKKDKK